MRALVKRPIHFPIHSHFVVILEHSGNIPGAFSSKFCLFLCFMWFMFLTFYHLSFCVMSSLHLYWKLETTSFYLLELRTNSKLVERAEESSG